MIVDRTPDCQQFCKNQHTAPLRGMPRGCDRRGLIKCQDVAGQDPCLEASHLKAANQPISKFSRSGAPQRRPRPKTVTSKHGRRHNAVTTFSVARLTSLLGGKYFVLSSEVLPGLSPLEMLLVLQKMYKLQTLWCHPQLFWLS